MLYGSLYFQSRVFLKCAENILLRELRKQILDDGAHYELSPMYHRIILHRVLDCVNFLQSNKTENFALQKLLTEKASVMLSWMNNMAFRNGAMPDFNDSILQGAPTPEQLENYAKQLGINAGHSQLGESGYRKFSFQKYELILDAGDITPSYNPGHTHADMLSFCMNINNKPVIVDCGTSTYKSNARRNYERSTAAHNTVSVNGLNQSDVWASFRVGKRAKIMTTASTKNSFSATLNGFTLAVIAHKRQWDFFEDKIVITDFVPEQYPCKAFLHFHPEISIKQNGDLISGDNFSITFSNHKEISLEAYDFAEGFNKTVRANMIVILFSGRLDTEIAI
jgi:Heparinase II/III-like protein/Heparinase II/III N-terminus